jgi:sugar (pentulose or hexulose) kinase
MKYYIWLDKQGRPLSQAWRYDDETERMAAERYPPAAEALLRAGTREQLMERFGLRDGDFAD